VDHDRAVDVVDADVEVRATRPSSTPSESSTIANETNDNPET
jgi:hypothetical protein